MAASINASTTAGVVTTADTSGVLNIQTANTTAISISASQVVSYTNNPTYSGGTANGVLYLNGSKVATSGSALTFDGTNLGVGVTPTSTAGTTELAVGSASTNPRISGIRDGVSAFVLTSDSVGSSLYERRNLPFLFGVNNTEQMRLTSTGLGIGTSSPNSKLNVNNGFLQIDISGTQAVRVGSSDSIVGGTTNNAVIQANTSKAITFLAGGTETARIDGAGNLGLGVTPSNAYTLTKSFEYQSGGIFPRSGETNFTFNATQNSGASWIYGATNSASLFQIKPASFVWQIAGSGTAGNAITFTQAMTLDASGNLGVGVTSPSVKLQVDGGSTPGTIGQFGNAQGGVILGAASSTAYVNTTSSSPLAFQINGTERARIDSSGNFQFNSGYGSVAIAYGCRVWVSYNTVTSTSIRGNGGVSSLTDNGTGDTTINFSVTMPDTNYSVVGATKLADSTTTTNNTMIVGPFSFGTTSVRIYTTRPGDSLNDCAIVNISIFR